MAFPVHAPRVNNNDDVVTVVELKVAAGEYAATGQVIAAVETDKSIIEVSAEHDGHVLQVLCEEGDQVAVGSIVMWLGTTIDEPVPEVAAPAPSSDAPGSRAEPTAKARALLAEHGLDASTIPTTGSRLTVSDIEAYLARSGTAGEPRRPDSAPAGPHAEGTYESLGPEELGMLRTVTWHRDEAAAAYLELPFDQSTWEAYAASYAESQRLLMSPLLPLMTHRLVDIARSNPKLNSTVVDGRRFAYRSVNIGFTIQVERTLYLMVVKEAERLSAREFIDALGDLQRRAVARKLGPEHTRGATLAFTSMAKWGVSRHVPILPPHTSIIVAHSAPGKPGARPNPALLGASYDHRVLSGYDVADALRALAEPPTD